MALDSTTNQLLFSCDATGKMLASSKTKGRDGKISFCHRDERAVVAVLSVRIIHKNVCIICIIYVCMFALIKTTEMAMKTFLSGQNCFTLLPTGLGKRLVNTA